MSGRKVPSAEILETTGRVLRPPEMQEVTGPLIFAAGPIQGAPDWQAEAIAVIQREAPDLHIASPRRDYLPGEFVYEAQVDWETAMLRRAAENGLVMFWLAREAESVPGRAYAQTSRFELAEWKVRHERDGTPLVVGIDDTFSNARYIRRRFAQDCPEVPVLDTLDETCRASIQLIRCEHRVG